VFFEKDSMNIGIRLKNMRFQWLTLVNKVTVFQVPQSQKFLYQLNKYEPSKTALQQAVGLYAVYSSTSQPSRNEAVRD
jgi:hypothetical protein